MSDADAITFAEKVLAMLDQGSFTATYKYAVLLALVDVCLEGVDVDGAAPTRVHPRQLARRVIELYWPHTSPYGDEPGQAVVLRQNQRGQAEIVQRVRAFREATEAAGRGSLARARHLDPHGWQRLVDEVAYKLAEMPLPRLQRFGRAEDRFLYDLDWSQDVTWGQWQRGRFDHRLRLRPGVGDHLVRLAGLLRPLVQRQWAEHIVALNRHEVPALEQQEDLDRFLFGAERTDLAPVRSDLRELQDGLCFYCREQLKSTPDVDHFLPWTRHPDDGIHNLVVAHRRCNNRKRDFLAAAPHVHTWTARFFDESLLGDLDALAEDRRWPAHPGRTLSVARALYLRLPDDARLWLGDGEFVTPDRAQLALALGAGEPIDRAAEDPGDFDADAGA